MSYLLLIIFSTILFIATWHFKTIKNFIRPYLLLERLSGPPRKNFLFGNVLVLHNQSPEDNFRTLREWGRQYSLYKLTIFPTNAANIVNPEDCERVFANNKHNSKSLVYSLLQKWLGSGLLLSSGTKWQTRRKILTPAFHFAILKDFVDVFNKETAELVDNLDAQSKIDPVIAITPFITNFALKSISETAMGVKMKFDTEEQQLYRNAIYELGELLTQKLMRPLKVVFSIFLTFTASSRREKELVQRLHTFTRKVISERRQQTRPDTIVAHKKKRLALLDILLEHQRQYKSIDDEGIREEVDTFMFEGHDTTSVFINYALMLIAGDATVQNRIVEEITEVLGESNENPPTMSDLQEMRYLEMCIKEALRLYPSVPFVSRRLGEDLITEDGSLLPEGSITHIHIYDLHRNPKIYPEPEKFDPDRFLPENCQHRHPFAYLPFSAGARNCIGQRFALLEVKTVLCGILRRFRLEPVDTPESIILIIDLVLRSKHHIKVKFLPRK